MLIKRPADIRSSEITDKKVYLNRREFVRAATGTAALAAAGTIGAQALLHAQPPAPRGAKLPNVKPGEFSTPEKLNSWEQITTYNNYYEFGTDKDSPAYYAKSLKPKPWSVAVEGEVAKPAVWNLEHPRARVANDGRFGFEGPAIRSEVHDSLRVVLPRRRNDRDAGSDVDYRRWCFGELR